MKLLIIIRTIACLFLLSLNQGCTGKEESPSGAVSGQPTAQAQLLFGILDPSRAIDWTAAGVTGGIPNRTIQCGSTIAPYDGDATTINTAIAACGTDQVVQLGIGTFNLTSAIDFGGRSNVTLRGAGPDQTIIAVVVNGPNECGGQSADICIHGTSTVFNHDVPAGNIVDWTAGYTQGTTTITVSDVTNIQVGQYIVLDQLDDTTDPGYLPFISCVGPWDISDCVVGRASRTVLQIVTVTGKSGNNLTISPGLYYTRWQSGRSPQVWWWGTVAETAMYDGVEDLTIDNTSSPATYANIEINDAANNWVKNVRSINGATSHIYMNLSAHNTIRDSYFYGVKSGGAPTSYGVESLMSSDNMIENNIFQAITAPFQWGGSTGNVGGYNFAVNMPWAADPSFMFNASFPTHEAGSMMHLLEGNQTNGVNYDLAHGSSALITAFRNRFTGFEAGRTQNTVPLIISGFIRFNNFVGNVLGTFGYHTNYESSNGPQGVLGDYDHSIFNIGFTSSAETNSGAGYDLLAVTSLLRWGNYDYATGTTRWNAAEIPSGNAVPGSHTLPSSFYLSNKPSWFGSVTWPPIGPDITGGADPSGHAYDIPAKRCYTNVMGGPADGSGSVLTFNANSC